MNSNWIVVSDFDGTLTKRDVGDEISRETIRPRFEELYARYKRGELDLKAYQKLVWSDFPLPEERFRERARFHGVLRPGVPEFLRLCASRGIPVFVASCGLRAYIEPVLEKYLDSATRRAIHEIRCNESVFGPQGIEQFLPPAVTAECPYPLDKGEWARELAARYPGRKILGLGNGTSDRSFWPKVDRLGATEGLAEWCKKNKVPFVPFQDFRDLMGVFDA